VVVVTQQGDAAAGPNACGEDVAAIVALFAGLAREDEGSWAGPGVPSMPSGEAAERTPSADRATRRTTYWQGVHDGRRIEEELVARISAMAARRDRNPMAVTYDTGLVTDAEYRRGLVAGRGLVHQALLVSRRMAHGEACPACGATALTGHEAACRYA
jgi:hypothetical protein